MMAVETAESATATLLEATLAEVRGLRERLDRIDQRHRDEDEPEAALLRAIDRAIGDREFSARGVIHHARVVGGELRRLLKVNGARNGRALGNLFDRIEDRDFGGLMLFRLAENSEGWIWRLKASGV